MNVSTPSPSSSVPLAKPARRRVLAPFVRPVASCGGALLLGGVLVHLFSPHPASTSPGADITAPAPMVVAQSQMMTAHLVPLAPRTLRGEFHLTTDVTGRSPVTGAVARQLVNVGSRVEAGDRVLEVSSGAISRPVPVAEKRQVRAEREQVDVARGQSALAQQLSIAQTQLATAQERVALAQQKVSSTRSLVKRLLAGDQIPATGDAASAPPRKRIRRKHRRLTSPDSASRGQGLIESLSSAKSALSAAQSEREEAHGAIDSAQKKLDSSKAALEKAQADFKAEKITADVLQSAHSDADDATGTLKSAQTRAEAADKTLALRQNKLEEAQSLAQKSRDDGRAQAKGDQEDTPDETETPSEKRFLTPTQAATLVAAALRESRAATQSADRMRSRVDNYQQQVKATSQQGESASRDMQVANQEVLDTTPRAVFTSARAPRSGTITWISRLAREVSDGQPVFGISQGRSGFLRFEDKGVAWKALKVGQTLNAAPIPHLEDVGATPTGKAAAVTLVAATLGEAIPKTGTSATNTLSTISSGATAGIFSVRLTRITPPQSANDAAEIDAVRVDGAGAPDAVDAFQVELPAEAVPQGSAPSGVAASPSRPVVVPASVVLPRDGVNYVAVMAPSQKALVASSLAKSATLSWRPIEIVRQTPFDVEIKSGVRDGEKIVNQPALLLSQWKPEDKKPFPILLDASG